MVVPGRRHGQILKTQKDIDMNYFYYIISALCLLCCCDLYAQELSDAGRGHWKAAQYLEELASSLDDWDLVAAELEKVTESDPDFPDTYLKLCKIYRQLALERGNKYLDKARSAMERYHAAKPDDITTYNDEMILLEALEGKIKLNIIDSYVGTWDWSDLTIYRAGDVLDATIPSEDIYFVDLEQVDDFLYLYIYISVDGKGNVEIKSYNGYRYTEERDLDTFRIWNENGNIYLATISSQSEYYYNGREVFSETWNNEFWYKRKRALRKIDGMN